MDLFEQYRKVYHMLEDEESKDIYLSRLNWLISDDYKYIKEIVKDYLPGMLPRCGKTTAELRDSMPSDRKVVFFGAGNKGKAMLLDWVHDERFIGFCSSTKEKQKSGYMGYPVLSPEELLSQRDLNVVVTTIWFQDEIIQILRDGGYPAEQIFTLRDYPVQIDPGQYFSPDFMVYEDEEIFADIGCFDLGSSIELKKHCKCLKKVYAFEPDPDNYQICLKRKIQSGLDMVNLLPYGTWSEKTTLCFAGKSGSGSHMAKNGDIKVPVLTIDEAIDSNERVTMIKMDVEGAELESLKGAKRIIQRHRPKLAICIYHKPEDMTAIPLYIKELVPEYKLYVRHHSDDGGETVLYAITK